MELKMTNHSLSHASDLTISMRHLEAGQMTMGEDHYALSDVEFSPIGESSITEGLEPPVQFAYPSLILSGHYPYGKDVAAVPVKSLIEMEGKKMLCNACGFLVRPDGHELRCRPPSALPVYLSNMAWIGDSWWDLFVRRVIIQAGLPKEAARNFTSVQFFSMHMEEIVGILNLGRVPAEDASIHARAVYVKAALAVSALCRIRLAVLAGREFGKWALLSWRHCAVITLEWENDFVPSPNLDGFCYLNLVADVDHKTSSRKLLDYPKWKKAKEHIPENASGVVYYVLLDGIYHVSKIPFHGMRKYDGRFRDLPFSDRNKIGGLKVVNFTSRIIGKSVHQDWSADMRSKAEMILSTTRTLRETGRAVMTTQRYWERFSRFFEPVGSQGDKGMKGTLDQGINAFVAIMQVAHVSGVSIGSSGVFSCASLNQPDVQEDHDSDGGISDFDFMSDSD